MSKDIFKLALDQVKENYAKFSIIATVASVAVGAIVAFYVVKGVIKNYKGGE